MKKTKGKRPYRMGKRAKATARTGAHILEAAIELWREGPLDGITLDRIAERAGVSVRTVIRHFGSRDGVIEACIETDAGGVRQRRDRAPAGDLDEAVSVLLEHYERDGDPIIRTLALEEQVPAARVVTQRGRAEHRRWCERVFGPLLAPAQEGADREAQVDALVAATDVFVWKLLRRDLGRSPEAAGRVIRSLIEGLLVSRNA